MTSVEIPPAARVARDAAWSVGHDIEELRESYAEILLALDRVRSTTDGSSHPAPAWVQRCWSEGLSLVDEVRAGLDGGIAALRDVPRVSPLATPGDLVATWAVASCGVQRVTTTLARMRQRIVTAANHLTDSVDGTPHPAALAARDRWRASLDVLDLLIVRLQHGVAALNAYADRVSGVSPRPTRRQRLAAVLPHLRYPPEGVAAGAGLAGHLVRAARHLHRDRIRHRDRDRRRDGDHRHLASTPPHLLGALHRDLLRALLSAPRRPLRPPPRLLPARQPWPRSGRALPAFCLRGVEHLTRGDVYRYAAHVKRLWDARLMDGYALALAAGLVVAAERRFPDREETQVRAVAHRLTQRYDPTGDHLDAAAAEGLLWAALGEGGDTSPDGRRVTLVATGTLLLLDLLADERSLPSPRRQRRQDWAGFLADAAELAEPAGSADSTDHSTGQADPANSTDRAADQTADQAPDQADAADSAHSVDVADSADVGRRGPASR